jgi:uncharacterized protein (UPF0305 family)
MKIQCEVCKEEYDIKELKTGFEMLPDKVERHYIECQNCDAKYTSHYLDAEMKALQYRIKKLREKKPYQIKQRNKVTLLTKQLTNMNEAYLSQYQNAPTKTDEKSG